MAEYHMTYRSLKTRLLTLKVLVNTKSDISERGRQSTLDSIDFLLKNLDERYSEEKPFSFVEMQLGNIENIMTK